MGNYKNLTVLHSNDLHGDFLSEKLDMKLLGGISMLSGYVSKVRAETPNTLYCIAGDMLQGSVIDSEYRGLSTIEIMNLIHPDVASIGNHEIDYGLAHLLFLERCARFPVINANLFIKNPYTRLFQPYIILEVDGMNIMFIGIITSEVMMGMHNDNLGSFVDVEDAAREVGHICNAYRNTDIDFTVLLTHIGLEEDKRLAALLDPEWGVDVIIGGHSHSILEQPEKVGDVLIVQAGVGTSQIGRFDIVVDTDSNAIHTYEWQLIPIDSDHCPRDEQMEKTILRFKSETDQKYNRVLCRFAKPPTHPDRYRETELGNFFADVLRDALDVDVMVLGSGSIRREVLDQVLTFGGLLEAFPYDDKILRLKVTGDQLQRMCAYVLRDEMFADNDTEFYQYSRGFSIGYDKEKKAFRSIDLDGAPLDSGQLYTIGLQEFHFNNFEKCFGFSIDEVCANDRPRVLTTSALDVLVEHLPHDLVVEPKVEGRIVLQ